MAKMTKPDELLYLATGTTPDGITRHFCVYKHGESVYKHGAAVLVTWMQKGLPGRHLCPVRIKTEQDIRSEIALVFALDHVTLEPPRIMPPA